MPLAVPTTTDQPKFTSHLNNSGEIDHMCARTKGITEYHLHKEQPARRQFDVFDLAQYVQGNADHCCTPHSHSFYQVIWFERGGGKHFVDLGAFDVVPNTVFFIAKNQVHHFQEHDDVHGKLIHFNDTFIVQHDPDIDILLNYGLFNDPLAPFFAIPDGLTAEIYRYLDQITRCPGNVRDNRSLTPYQPIHQR